MQSSEEEKELTEWKPQETRVIVEKRPMIKLIEKNMKCPSCNGQIEASFETVTLATSLHLKCCSSSCSFIDHSDAPAPAILPQLKNDNRERNTDYAINILYVLGFIVSGDGPREACRLLGLLGLRNDTTMETRSFATIEERIAPVI
jgi:hypothetical protein